MAQRRRTTVSDKTAILTCDTTANPTMGCDGCELWCAERRSCYAAALHKRHGGINPGYATDFNRPERFPGRVAKYAKLSDLTGLRRQGKPWLDGRPRIIFISDMGDALAGSVSFEYLEEEIVDSVTSPAGQRHWWKWLTKRPGRMAEFSRWLRDLGREWPVNLWAGTTITSQDKVTRLDELLEVGDERTRRFVSVEPLLEKVDLRGHLHGLDWIVLGGESGGKRTGDWDPMCDPRPFHLEWARDMRDQCKEAGVAYFLKQVGAMPHENGERLHLRDGHGLDWSEWPEDLRVREGPEAPKDRPIPPDRVTQEKKTVPARGSRSPKRGTAVARPRRQNQKGSTVGSRRRPRKAARTRGKVAKHVNFCTGCRNDCIYCWARNMAVDRYHRLAHDEWPNEVVRDHDVRKGRKLVDLPVRCPFTHDITPGNIDAAETVLLKLLEPGNGVLILSKPRVECIERLTRTLRPFMDRIHFRFTIGVMDEELRRFWEPGAPAFEERLKALQTAYAAGYATSVSAEPLVEPWNAAELLAKLRPFITGSFWVGKLNDLVNRTKWLYPDGHPEIDRLELWQTDEKVLEVYEALREASEAPEYNPLVRWKKSYREVLGVDPVPTVGLDV